MILQTNFVLNSWYTQEGNIQLIIIYCSRDEKLLTVVNQTWILGKQGTEDWSESSKVTRKTTVLSIKLLVTFLKSLNWMWPPVESQKKELALITWMKMVAEQYKSFRKAPFSKCIPKLLIPAKVQSQKQFHILPSYA